MRTTDDFEYASVSGPSSLEERSAQVVLLVDDDESFREACATQLHKHGFEVEECEDSRVALAMVLRRLPAVLVIEMHPTGFDGAQLCKLLRRDRNTRKVRTLLMLDQEDNVRPSGTPVDGVLIKPVPPEIVCEEIQRLVAHAQNGAAPRHSSVPARAPGTRRRIAEMRSRQTDRPPVEPPPLHCQECGHSLQYEHSYLSGPNINHPEQWDRFVCPAGCGSFLWRHRVRQLTRADLMER